MSTEHEELAYHFVGDTLRDGRPVPANGVWLIHDGPVIMCRSGLHASLDAFDALQFAPGPMLCKVAVREIVARHPDKIVARQRCIITRFDATDPLYQFAREQALSVIHLWGAPEVVREYLTTGDRKLRGAARDAAWDAAWDATWDGARDYARAAAKAATWAAARNAAWAAARAAITDAITDAAWDAARDGARDAARTRFNQLVTARFDKSEYLD